MIQKANVCLNVGAYITVLSGREGDDCLISTAQHTRTPPPGGSGISGLVCVGSTAGGVCAGGAFPDPPDCEKEVRCAAERP